MGEYSIPPEVLLRLIDEVRNGSVGTIPNSVLVVALGDTRFEVQNIANILLKRRGIQIVEAKLKGRS